MRKVSHTAVEKVGIYAQRRILLIGAAEAQCHLCSPYVLIDSTLGLRTRLLATGAVLAVRANETLSEHDIAHLFERDVADGSPHSI